MKAIFLLFVCLANTSALAQSTNEIDLKNSNHNVIRVNQGGIEITYNLINNKDSQNFLKYLIDNPKIAQQLDQLIASLGQMKKDDREKIERFLNQELLRIARSSRTSEGFFDQKVLIKNLFAEKNQLRAKIFQLQAKISQLEAQLVPYKRLITTTVPILRSRRFENKDSQYLLKLQYSLRTREIQLMKVMSYIDHVKTLSNDTKPYEKQLTFRVGYGPTNFLTATGEALPVQLSPGGSMGFRLKEHHLLPPLGIGLAIDGMYLPFNTLTKIANENRLIESFKLGFLTVEPSVTFHSLGLGHHFSNKIARELGYFVSAGWRFSYPFIINYSNFSTNEHSTIQGKFMNWPMIRAGIEYWSQAHSALPKKVGKQFYVQYEPIDLTFHGQGQAKAHIYEISVGVSFSLK